jgi:glutaryl-CoA dehydrogenase (non-decarboxylating)
VAQSALDVGRLSVAFGCVGIGQACLDASVRYASSRVQGGTKLSDHQLIRRLLSEALTNVNAAWLLCLQAARERDDGDPDALVSALMAKYFASRVAMKTAEDAVQIHGANGCAAGFAVDRHFRDAKVMEIIEGSNQIQELTIAQYAAASAGRRS